MHADADAVTRWAQRGLVACRVLTRGEWSVVVPAETAARAKPPYDNAVAMLAGRPVASRLRPALGLFDVDGRAVVTVHSSGWGAVQRWLVWDSDHGVVRTSRLAPARPRDLLALPGHRVVGTVDVIDLLRLKGLSPGQWLARLAGALNLPVVDLLADPAPGESAVIEPSSRAVKSFEATVSEERNQ